MNEEDGTRTVYVAAGGREPERVCEGCVRPTDWSSDEKLLLVFAGTPYQIDLLDVATHQQKPLLKHPTQPVVTSLPITAGSALRFGRHRLTRGWLSRPSMGRGPFPKAPGSISRTYGSRIGQIGRRTAGRSTLPPGETDTDVCGAGASMRFPIGQSANLSRHGIFTAGRRMHTVVRMVGRRPPGESPLH